MNNLENLNEKLIAIINEKLDKVNATIEERARAIREIELIKRNNDARVFLFYYDLIEFMKKENIYFMARGAYYTSLYCSYLLGFLEYKPMHYNLSTKAYEEGSKAFSIEIQKSRYDDVLSFIRNAYGERLFKTTTNLEPASIYYGRYILSSSDLADLERLKIDGETAVKLPKNTYKGNDFFVFSLLSLNSLDRIQKAENSTNGIIDYENYSDINVYKYLSKVKLTPMFFSTEEIARRKPSSIIELAYCTDKNQEVTERNLPHYVNCAILYYKLAKLRLMALVNDSIEVK